MLFKDTIMSFLIQYRNNPNYISHKEWGNFLVLLQENIFIKEEKNLNMLIQNNEYINTIKLFDKFKESYTPVSKPTSLSSIFDITNDLIYIGDNKKIVDLVNLALNKESLTFLNYIYNFTYQSLFEEWISSINSNYDKNNNISIINGCLFVVTDLELFLKDIRNKGYNINGGPQKFRAQANSMNSFLISLDIDFRNSLYNHNRYHVESGNINENLIISKDKFSFRNIHMNMGNIGW